MKPGGSNGSTLDPDYPPERIAQAAFPQILWKSLCVLRLNLESRWLVSDCPKMKQTVYLFYGFITYTAIYSFGDCVLHHF